MFKLSKIVKNLKKTAQCVIVKEHKEIYQGRIKDINLNLYRRAYVHYIIYDLEFEIYEIGIVEI